MTRRWQVIVGWVLGAVALGVLGTLSYNTSMTLFAWQNIPVGLILCILALAAYAVLARLGAGFAGIAGTTLALFVTSEALTLRGPGGDVLVPAGYTSSYIWLVSAIAIPLAVVFLPRRWFAPPRPVFAETSEAPAPLPPPSLPPASLPLQPIPSDQPFPDHPE